ncbi:MAG: hypothetical protein ACK5C0_08240 [Candidatus Kapaibacterium sp.]|jgi:hypothetical protein
MKLMKRALILTGFLCCVFIVPCYSQQKNILLMDSLAQRAVASIVPDVQQWKPDSLALQITSHEASYLITDKMFTSLAHAVVFNEKARIICSLSLLDYGITYTATQSSSDSLIREARLMGSGTVRNRESDIRALQPFTFIMRDTIARSSVGMIENSALPFTQAPVPAMPPSFWHEIAEPIIFVSGAALTVFLLFSLRSN